MPRSAIFHCMENTLQSVKEEVDSLSVPTVFFGSGSSLIDLLLIAILTCMG